jgi:thiol-disulfide isomerase/thioredoxin
LAKSKKTIMVALLAFLAVSIAALIYNELARASSTDAIPLAQSSGAVAAGAPTPPAAAAPAVAGSRVVAYYFHGTSRCTSCLTIEKYFHDAIQKYFANELKSGKLEFHAINAELPANQHYIRDYQLTTRSVVLALYRDGRQVRWANLQDVWLLLNNQERFYQYVKDNVASFLQEAQ